MRIDISVYNEATGFCLHAAGFAGAPREDVLTDLRRSVEQGLILPISLAQDGSPHIRLVTGNLTPEEDAEWVDRFAWKLRVPDGVLVLEGGLDPRGPREEFMRSIAIDPGDYRVEVYTCFWGINGTESLAGIPTDPVGAWFRKTRPNEDFPDNMKFHLGENGDEDPGHEDEWMEFYDSEDYGELEEPDLVDFIVRLAPLQPAEALEMRCGPGGWFPIGIAPRKPARCPVGLKFNRRARD